MHPFAAVSYDIAFAYAYAVERILDFGLTIDGQTMLESLKRTDFIGVTGHFGFDENVCYYLISIILSFYLLFIIIG